jgi:type II secretory pathway predicted ATPase ExeA/cell division septation protein DedD
LPSPSDALTYEPYFGLIEKPFSLNADPRFLYDSPSHAATRQSLLAGLRRREGLHVLTGQIGTGKTTLCRAVLRDLGRNTYSSLVPDPFASREDLLKMLLIDFGVVPMQEVTTGDLRQASRTELGFVLGEFLNSVAADAFVVVIIDEAQHLSLPLIEETRILFDTFGARGRLQIVFAGQPELHAKLKLPEMRQVDQRVCGYHRLAPMTGDAVWGYIQHRLHAAGARPDRVLFPPKIVDELHRRSGGVPRLINRICDRALQLAFERKTDDVNREILDTALLEVGSATLSPTWDSILFEEPAKPAAPPAPKAVMPPAPVADAVERTRPIDTEEHSEAFKKQVDHWVAKDLAAPPPPERRSVPKMPGRRQSPERIVRTEWPRDVRPEPYIDRLFRRWAKRAAILFAAFLLLNTVIVSVSLAGNLLTPTALPAFPQPPTPAVPGLAPLAVPSVADSAVNSGVSSAVDSGQYFVAVGMFASRERADQLVEALTQAGLAAMQRPVQLRQQHVQQIVLGPLFTRTDADAALRRLQALGGYDDARVIVQ